MLGIDFWLGSEKGVARCSAKHGKRVRFAGSEIGWVEFVKTKTLEAKTPGNLGKRGPGFNVISLLQGLPSAAPAPMLGKSVALALCPQLPDMVKPQFCAIASRPHLPSFLLLLGLAGETREAHRGF